MFDGGRRRGSLVRDDPPDPADLALLDDLGSIMMSQHDFGWASYRGGRPGDEAAGTDENPNLPAGYTYLLQLVAHDLVKSSLSLADTAGEARHVANTRHRPLSLETIYEGGPADCPHIYATRGRSGGAARLRVAPFNLESDDPPDPEARPRRDIARACPYAAGRRAPTIAVLADARNDDHAILSQLTAIFHHLHNVVIDATSAATGDPQRRFLFARTATAMVYREILRRDVLPRLLHKGVLGHYRLVDAGGRMARAEALEPRRAPLTLEFTHAAFRFGHAMSRNDYLVNEAARRLFSGALEQSSERGFASGFPARTWLVRWSLFFDMRARRPGSPAPNFSKRMAPTYSLTLTDRDRFPPVDGTREGGLAARDLISGHMANLLAVAEIHAGVAKANGTLGGMLGPLGDSLAALRAWLARSRFGEKTYSRADGTTTTFLDLATRSPPLLLFLLHEAATAADAEGNRGCRLGPLASIIVAETIYGALRAASLPCERDRGALHGLPDQLRALADAMLGGGAAGALGTFKAGAVMTDLEQVADMPALLEFILKHARPDVEDPDTQPFL